MSTYLGVDAGGTTTRSVLVDAHGRVFSRGSAGPANHRTASRSAAAEAVRTAIRAACPDLTHVSAIGIGWSGLEARGSEAEAREIVGDRISAEHFVLDSDVYAAHVGAFRGGPGLLISAGTGSMALGVDSSGKRIRTGGWGYLYGDEGSATWIAREAIRAALKATEGRAEAHRLWTALMRFTGMDGDSSALPEWTALAVTDWLYSPARHVSQIAGFARTVYDLALEDDAPSRRILKRAGHGLAELVTATRTRSQDDSLLNVAGSGSVWLENHLVRESCMRSMQQTRAGFRFVDPELEPDMGAALMAMRVADGV